MEKSTFRFLKWGNDVVGLVHNDLSLTFTEPAYNTVVRLYSKGHATWNPDEFLAFLSERIMSSSRRDIKSSCSDAGFPHTIRFALPTPPTQSTRATNFG